MKFRWLWVFIALSITGCTSKYAAKPEMALVDLGPGEVTLFETGLKAVVRIDNGGQVYVTQGFGLGRPIPVEHTGRLELK